MARPTNRAGKGVQRVMAESPVAWFFEYFDGLYRGDGDRAGRAQRNLYDLGFDVKVRRAKMRRRAHEG